MVDIKLKNDCTKTAFEDNITLRQGKDAGGISAFGALAMGGLVVTVSNAPLLLNSSPEAEYKMPENLPGKSGGSFLFSREIEEISVDVAKAHGRW
jgi:hypothetical protein